jgi:hypothetical protein
MHCTGVARQPALLPLTQGLQPGLTARVQASPACSTLYKKRLLPIMQHSVRSTLYKKRLLLIMQHTVRTTLCKQCLLPIMQHSVRSTLCKQLLLPVSPMMPAPSVESKRRRRRRVTALRSSWRAISTCHATIKLFDKPKKRRIHTLTTDTHSIWSEYIPCACHT